jgi:hypothetical protein
MTTKHSPTVAILYGFAEGPLVSGNFRKLLRRKGFKVTTDPAHADIIVTHSGGVYYLPEQMEGKTLLIVAPTYWRPYGSLVKASLVKLIKEMRYAAMKGHFLAWLKKAAANGMYVVVKLPGSFGMWRAAKSGGLEMPVHKARRIGVVSHHGDSWSGYIEKVALDNYVPYCLISNCGSHDDIWLHPKDYVAVIQYLYES